MSKLELLQKEFQKFWDSGKAPPTEFNVKEKTKKPLGFLRPGQTSGMGSFRFNAIGRLVHEMEKEFLVQARKPHIRKAKSYAGRKSGEARQGTKLLIISLEAYFRSLGKPEHTITSHIRRRLALQHKISVSRRHIENTRKQNTAN